MTQKEQERVLAWFVAVADGANKLGDELDPKRTRKNELVRKIDSIGHSAVNGKFWVLASLGRTK